MKRAQFDYDVKAELEVTWKELQNMWACSKSHYDFACKGLSEQGPLNALRNRFYFEFSTAEPGETPEAVFARVPADHTQKWTFTRRELDLLAKTLEDPLADMNLYYGVRQILRDVDDEWCRLAGVEPQKRGPILHAQIESMISRGEIPRDLVDSEPVPTEKTDPKSGDRSLL